MVSLLGNRLPKFTKEESAIIKGSYDFLGVNYYSTYYAQSTPPTNINMTYYTDMQANVTRKYLWKIFTKISNYKIFSIAF
jgi:beta-glucosidase